MFTPILAHGSIWIVVIVLGLEALDWVLALCSVIVALKKERSGSRKGFGAFCGLAAIAIATLFTSISWSGMQWSDPWFFMAAGPILVGFVGTLLSLRSSKHENA